jgi:hypothetical protein
MKRIGIDGKLKLIDYMDLDESLKSSIATRKT